MDNLSSAPHSRRVFKYLREYWPFYVLIAPTLISFIIFNYIPMYGVQIAFKDYVVKLGVWDSPWVGLKHIERFISLPGFWTLMRNTFLISFYSLLFGFPVPILLALMINELTHARYKKTVQMVSYAPYFLSTVAVCGLVVLFFKRETGIINLLLVQLGFEGHSFLTDTSWFRTIFVGSGIWQSAGFGTIIYLAVLSQVDLEIIEAAVIDGASRMQKIWYIYLPMLIPIITIQLILNAGSMLNVGFEKVFLLQNDLIMETADVISTYIYRVGLLGGQFSYTTAIGFFNSLINASLLVIVNTVAKRLKATTLW